ncbi:MAG: UDP-N-acetylglucosamine 1-carboxyvinyltransferase [Oligoflexia bacterium]|nr:UDP-N-acetylglucosamine 1-carboxyvinyltransferase [Oligoflexia bacterium]
MADIIEINGGVRLSGTVRISGAKNAALPMMMAALLSAEECIFENVPNLEDVGLTLHLLEHLGASTEYTRDRVSIHVPRLLATEASYSLVKALRASFWVLGPLLARGRAARVALPGGDIIGARPVDLHLAALQQMGAEITTKHGVVYATAVNGLRPARVELRFPSVGATHQIMMAASLVPGTSEILGAAREPEVVALAAMLNDMGAEIEGAGTDHIVIRGRSELGGVRIKLIGDRIEAGTYLLAAATTQGQVRVEGVAPDHLGAFLPVLSEMGAQVEVGSDWVSATFAHRPKALQAVTAPFPGLATDLQAPLVAALCFAEGESKIDETVFEGRFAHVAELARMGAQLTVHDRAIVINGVSRLSAAPVEAHDIRAGAAIILAALGAEGISHIHEIQHLRRGYETLERKLQGLGARVGARQTEVDDFLFSGC